MEKFNHDLTRLYQFSQTLQAQDRAVFETLSSGSRKAVPAVDALLDALELPREGADRLAAARRLYMLREDGLLQRFKTRWPGDESRLAAAREKAREAARILHESRLQSVVDFVQNETLLSPFYRAVLAGLHRVGLAFNRWHPVWLEAITRSHAFIEAAAGSAGAAPAWLEQNALLDPGDANENADRCYSVLDQNGKILTYAQAFGSEIAAIVQALEALKTELSNLEDPDLDEKAAWLGWLGALTAAFNETDRSQTLLRWREVDAAWMAIGGPIQPGHPLEYYEDAYRRAVAPEWDVRLALPGSPGTARKAAVGAMAQNLFAALNQPAGKKAVDHAANSLEKTRLFVGRPLLYYGALLDGLFSAQVVPNDEQVSLACGKKIFAFADAVLQTAQMRPAMRLEEEIFDAAFLSRYRTLVHTAPERWLRVYDIETVGHELGHVLWMDEATETLMNKSGAFKLIEEFKATAGGLMAFFDEGGSEEARADLAVCHAKRAVELIGWRESSEVSAYYHEALIHLCGLFESGMARFDGRRLHIDTAPQTLDALERWYRATYADLARHYLDKNDAALFLARFARNKTPLHPEAERFVAHYWQRWQAIGQEVAQEVNRAA